MSRPVLNLIGIDIDIQYPVDTFPLSKMYSVTEPAVAMYQCGFCKAEYGRADHLVRHVRGHTKQRPFICNMCGKGFARQDLLKRHASTHNGEYVAGSDAEVTILAQQRRYSHRVHQACRSCASKKVKCTDQKPCKRCRESGIACEYEQGLSSPIPDHESREEGMPEAEAHDQSLILMGSTSLEHDLENDLEFGLLRDNNDNNNANGVVSQSSTVDILPVNSMPSQADVMQDILGSTLTLPDFGDFIEIDPNPILDDMDFSFLNNTALNTCQPSPVYLAPSLASVSSPNSSAIGAGAEAYRRSLVHRGWEPGREENHELEHQNLVLPHNIQPECLNSSSEMTSMTKKTLSLSMRDRILAMILRTASAQAVERTVASFPPVEVLRDLIHLAFVRMRNLQAIPVIHVPSFDLNEQRPELLAALIAYGSIYSPSPSVRRFGYAIQETVRIAMNQLVEQQHAALREHDVCQAFYMQLYLAYYSGISRKIEMAECISMLGATVLRRGKMLQTQNYVPPEAFLDLPGLSLHEKWLKWVDQESRTRLVYFAFTLDAHVSASRNISVLFPYSELETPLPTAKRLWEADSATKWRDVLQHDVELRGHLPPSLSAILRHPCLSIRHKLIADMTCTALAFLAGFWGMVHEYQQMNTILSSGQSWNDFVLNSRYSEMNSTLEQFRAELADLDDVRPEVLIIQEFMGLHLNVSFYELSKYAGIGTDEDAQRAVPYVQKWFESPQSRAALWHAGQIFRATKLLPTGSLTDVYVIALYHAAITLWVWGMLFRGHGSTLGVNSQKVSLDGEESPAVSRYLKASRTLPGLTASSGDFLSLDNLTTAPDLANDIVMANWCLEPLPLTAEEVSRLMQGISKICRQRFKAVLG